MKHGILLLTALLSAVPARADFINGQPADRVLGLPERPKVTPAAVVVDPLTQKVFVSDYAGNRVLRYGTTEALQSDALPEAVLGQSDLYGISPKTGAAGLKNPIGTALDGAGRLWVADRDNHRLLRFDNASGLPTGASASGVLGQSNLDTSISGTAENRLINPTGVAVDKLLGAATFSLVTPAIPPKRNTFNSPYGFAMQNADLWVADTDNDRVLRFANAGTKSNGADADSLLGQFNFSERNAGSGPADLNVPYALAVSGARLWIADAFNNRLVRHEAAAAKFRLEAADGTLAQSPPAPDTELGSAYPTAIDPVSGKLFLCDRVKNRVVRYASARALATRAQPKAVFGQPDFALTTAGTTSSKMKNPEGLNVDILANL